MSDRLFLLETSSFQSTPNDMLDILIRIIADRSLGQVFFNDFRLMDYELIGWGARKAIQEEAAKRG